MKPGEHKTVQARILKYATDIGWTFVSRYACIPCMDVLPACTPFRSQCVTASRWNWRCGNWGIVFVNIDSHGEVY